MIQSFYPFSIFKNTVHVLAVDDDWRILDLIQAYLESFHLYIVDRASRTADAIKVIEKSNSRYHVCVMDRGLGDVEGNEFYLMDRYRQKMPIIVITGRKDSEKAFECGEHGGKKVVAKGENNFLEKVLTSINEFALKSIVCPGCHESASPFLNRCYDTLVGKKPFSVEALAQCLHMSERSLRIALNKNTRINPKYSICLFHLYSKLFECVEACASKGIGIDLKKYNSERLADPDYAKNYIRFCKYFLRKRTIFDNLLQMSK